MQCEICVFCLVALCPLVRILFHLNQSWHLLYIHRLRTADWPGLYTILHSWGTMPVPFYWWWGRRGKRGDNLFNPFLNALPLSGWFWKDAPGFPPAKHQAEKPQGIFSIQLMPVFFFFFLNSETSIQTAYLSPVSVAAWIVKFFGTVWLLKTLPNKKNKKIRRLAKIISRFHFKMSLKMDKTPDKSNSLTEHI